MAARNLPTSPSYFLDGMVDIDKAWTGSPVTTPHLGGAFAEPTPASVAERSNVDEAFDLQKSLSAVHTMLTWVYENQRKLEQLFSSLQTKVDSMQKQLESLHYQQPPSQCSGSEYSYAAVDDYEAEITDDSFSSTHSLSEEEFRLEDYF